MKKLIFLFSLVLLVPTWATVFYSFQDVCEKRNPGKKCTKRGGMNNSWAVEGE